MSDLWGANPDELDALAGCLSSSADRVDQLRTSVRSELFSIPWEGRDGDQFRNRWDSEGVRLLSAASAILRTAGNRVSTNAADQRRASASEGGTFAGAGAGSAPGGSGSGGSGSGSSAGGDPVVAPVPGAEYAGQIASTRTAMEDDLDRRREHLHELEGQLAHADGGIEEWFKDKLPIVDSDAEAIQGRIDSERRSVERLEALLKDPSRQFLKVDVNGDGRIIEVQGDLAGAERIAIFVPGMDTSIDSYTTMPNDYSTHLFDEMRDSALPGVDVAVVSYLDYNPPDMDRSLPLGAGEGRATEGAANLSGFVAGLHDAGYTSDQITVIAHSYGSTVTGIALEEHNLGVSTVAVVGSPGLGDGVDDISDLGRPDVHVYAGRAEGVPIPILGSGDPVSWLPVHGEDPADSGFGADRFDTGNVTGHSGYFDEDSTSLINLALIALGQQPTLR